MKLNVFLINFIQLYVRMRFNECSLYYFHENDSIQFNTKSMFHYYKDDEKKWNYPLFVYR